MRRSSLCVLLLAGAVFLLPLPALPEAGDRDELAKVLALIPPNGPFWKYGNVTMRQKTTRAGVQPVVFSHWVHRPRYTCRVCHMELGFGMKSGETGITRRDYMAGKYCGACHDGKIAFNVRDGDPQRCATCHVENPAFLVSRFEEMVKKLPMTNFGNGIDWSAALGSGLISPKTSLAGDKMKMQFPDKLKKPLRMTTVTTTSEVIFSHEDHFAELDCSNCHPDVFQIKRKGTERFSMEANLYGAFCGACHMRVAFPMNDCRRCHPRMTAY